MQGPSLVPPVLSGKLFDRSPVPVVVHRRGCIQYINAAAMRMLGAEQPEQIVGKTALDIVHPDFQRAVSERIQHEGREALPVLEERLLRIDGTTIDVEVSAWPIEDNSAAATVVMLNDITGRRAAEAALRESEVRFRGLFEDAPVAYHEIDEHGVIRRVNRAECELLGFEREELIGLNAWDVVASAQRELSRVRVAQKLTGTERLVPFERPYTRRDGVTLLLEVHEKLIRDESGKAIGIRTAVLDITQKKLAEEQLKSYSTELQRKNQELDCALIAAREAAELKSQFLANMSHEIRTPMNGVIGMTGLLLDTNLSREQRDYVETVRRSGEALLTVINDILDFSKIEAGKLQIESFPFDLFLVVEEVTEMLAHKAEDHGLELVVEYPPAVPRRFVGDAGRIRQVLTNLVGNALKFTHSGSVVVSVQCRRQDSKSADLRIAVCDTGVGIPAGKIGSLFEKFSQVDGSPTRKYGGTGLGLAISKQLVELMNGTIGVESRLGEGSTFWFKVPLLLDPAPYKEPLGAIELQGLRALIVDDNDVNRRVLEEQLANWGMRTHSLAGAGGVIETLREARNAGDPYEFVLLDYQMPGMDGATLAAAIKADAAVRDVSLIMLTSVGHVSEVRQMEGSRIEASLLKPVRESHILNALAGGWAKKTGRSVPAPPEEQRKRFEGSFAGVAIRVLVAEDNVVNQKVATRMLERLGLRADVVSNGQEAVAMSQIVPYDLILMDCQMPEMDGYAASQEIRRLEAGARRVVIIAMTAEAMAGARDECIQAGMDDYIAKPVQLQALAETLRQWAPRATSHK
jgi:PAS domain S-box-containing protein